MVLNLEWIMSLELKTSLSAKDFLALYQLGI